MKITLRIPTADPYAYIEIEDEYKEVDSALDLYQEVTERVKLGDGLEPKDFNAILDEYHTTNKITADPGIMSLMSIDQSSIIQAIKRSRARTNK